MFSSVRFLCLYGSDYDVQASRLGGADDDAWSTGRCDDVGRTNHYLDVDHGLLPVKACRAFLGESGLWLFKSDLCSGRRRHCVAAICRGRFSVANKSLHWWRLRRECWPIWLVGRSVPCRSPWCVNCYIYSLILSLCRYSVGRSAMLHFLNSSFVLKYKDNGELEVM
jgi:hypothetical protein